MRKSSCVKQLSIFSKNLKDAKDIKVSTFSLIFVLIMHIFMDLFPVYKN